ncbi:protein of unknown function DUF1707 [Acidothermus cellulolyticus 11B]|uniref:DUF1707 domain-containing protein n=2 Tax=Acidothermus cellulolyticus TaxID=28049 RepID=A0LUX9_ACIC1|nr:protein of unknown function DUF1707 [Acidothermus cellulolyticus 11B]
MANSGYLRIGDAERDQAIELLGRHFADGRLTQEEYEERLSAALRARTRADLTALFSDLPQLPPAVPAVRPRRIMPWLIPVACCLLLALALLVAVDHGIAPFLVVLGAFVVIGGGRRRGRRASSGGWPPRHDVESPGGWRRGGAS